jgi:hypothetical protein
MCQMASFLYRNKSELEIKVYQLDSHSGTQLHLGLTEAMGWYEGHYLPHGEILCRTPKGNDELAEKELERRYPTFIRFLKWAFKQELDFSGNLDLSECDLKGIKLPDNVGGYLDLCGCKLRGNKLPSVVGKWIDLSYCDLTGLKLPNAVYGWLALNSCKLKGTKLPTTVSGDLEIRGCDLKGVKLPSKVGGYLDIIDCKNVNIKAVRKLKPNGHIYT